MTARRILATGAASAALFASGVTAWVEFGLEDAWSGGEPGVVLAGREEPPSPSPSPSPSPTPTTTEDATPEQTGPTAVYPRPNLPSGATESSPPRSNAPDHSGSGEGAPGRGNH